MNSISKLNFLTIIQNRRSNINKADIKKNYNKMKNDETEHKKRLSKSPFVNKTRINQEKKIEKSNINNLLPRLPNTKQHKSELRTRKVLDKQENRKRSNIPHNGVDLQGKDSRQNGFRSHVCRFGSYRIHISFFSLRT